jgi:hypothetical protein
MLHYSTGLSMGLMYCTKLNSVVLARKRTILQILICRQNENPGISIYKQNRECNTANREGWNLPLSWATSTSERSTQPIYRPLFTVHFSSHLQQMRMILQIASTP